MESIKYIGLDVECPEDSNSFVLIIVHTSHTMNFAGEHAL